MYAWLRWLLMGPTKEEDAVSECDHVMVDLGAASIAECMIIKTLMANCESFRARVVTHPTGHRTLV